MNFYNQVYNVIASIIVYLETRVKKNFYEHYISMSSESYIKYRDDIRCQLPEMFHGDETEQCRLSLNGNQERESFILKLLDFVDLCEKDDEIILLAVLVELLDTAVLAVRENSFLMSIDDYIRIDALNTNFMQKKIKLLPRYECLWEHKNRGIYYGLGINNTILKHSYYIKCDDSDEYNIKSIIVKPTLENIFQDSPNLVIGVSPVTNKNVLETEENYIDNEWRFDVKGLKDEQLIKEKVFDILKEAIEKKVDILIFPEMLGTDDLVKDVCDYLETDGNGYPKFTVLPSIWKNNKNESVVVDSIGDVVFRQNKHERYFYEKSIKEGEEEKIKVWENITSDKNIYILHWKGIGRIVVAICKDYIQTGYTDYLIQKLHATLILSPSFSTGSYGFQTTVSRGQIYDCNTAWVNTCAAFKKDSESDENSNMIAIITNYGNNNTRETREEKFEIYKKDICLDSSCNKVCLCKRNISIK